MLNAEFKSWWKTRTWWVVITSYSIHYTKLYDYDLPLALGLLAAAGVLDPASLEGYYMAGELSLDGARNNFV